MIKEFDKELRKLKAAQGRFRWTHLFYLIKPRDRQHFPLWALTAPMEWPTVVPAEIKNRCAGIYNGVFLIYSLELREVLALEHFGLSDAT